MLASEWAEVVDEVEALWGRSAKWRTADSAYRFARSIPAAAARAAVETLFLTGAANAPSPAEVLRTAASKIDSETSVEEIRRYCEVSSHSYAIVDEKNGVRLGVCARCGDEISRPANLLTTETEREDGVGGRVVDDSAVSEAISP